MKAKTVKAKSEPPAPAPYRTEVDEQRLDAAVSSIEARFPGNPRESTARAVAHVYRSIVVLVGEPFPPQLIMKDRTMATKTAGEYIFNHKTLLAGSVSAA